MNFLLIDIIGEKCTLEGEIKSPSFKSIQAVDIIELQWDTINDVPILIKEYNYVIDSPATNDIYFNRREKINIRTFLHLYNGLSNTSKLIISNSHIRHRNCLEEQCRKHNVKFLHLKGIKLLTIAGLFRENNTKKVTISDILKTLEIKKELKDIDDIINITLLILAKNKELLLNYVNGTLRL